MCIAVTDERETLLPSPDSVVLELERLARVLVAATGVALEEGSPATGLTVQQWRIHVILARAGALRLRDVAIAALQAMGNGNEATVKGIQGQLLLIQTELQELRNRAASPYGHK